MKPSGRPQVRLKDTEIGPLPENWEVIRIGKAGDVLGGRQRSPNRVGEPCKYLRVANVFDGLIDTSKVFEMPFTEEERKRFLLKPGDILLNEGQSRELVGRSAIYSGEPPECCFQNTLIRFRPGPSILTDFAQAVFQRYVATGRFSRLATQTTAVAHLGAGNLAAVLIPRPPTSEQSAIASVLSNTDGLIASLDALIEKKRAVMQGTMQLLLSEYARLPGFRRRWESKTLGEVFTLQNGFNFPSSAYGSGMPLANVLEAINFTHLHASNLQERVAVNEQQAERYSVRRGDVLFNRTSETEADIALASVYVDDAPAVFGGFVIRGRPISDDLDMVYSGYALRAQRVRRQLVRLGQGGIRTNIGQADLSETEIHVPPIAEQQAIASMLSDLDEEIASMQERRDKVRGIKQGMMQSLLTGRVRLFEPAGGASISPGLSAARAGS